MRFYVGSIYHISDLPIDPKHGKFAVCVCVAPRLFFLINSENRAMYDCIPLPKMESRSFLNHDSYIGCKFLHEADDNQVDGYKGKLTNEELQALVQKIKSSAFLTKIQKDLLVKSIENELEERKIP